MDDAVGRAVRMAVQSVIFSLLIGTVIVMGLISRTYLNDYSKAQSLQEDMLAQKELVPYKDTLLKSDDVLITVKTKTKTMPMWIITEHDRDLSYFATRGLLLDETVEEHVWSITRMTYVDKNGVENIETGLTYRLEASGGMYSTYKSYVMPHHLMNKADNKLDVRDRNIKKIMLAFEREYGFGRQGIIFVKTD